MNAIVKPSISPRQAALIFLALALASGVGVALSQPDSSSHTSSLNFNLVWNLFLAWLPLGFAVMASRFRGSRRPAFTSVDLNAGTVGTCSPAPSLFRRTSGT